jgi:hypothetical protein
MAEEKDAARIWGQTAIPVIYRQGGSAPLLMRVPYRPDNRTWLRSESQRKPEWNPKEKHWKIPKSWFERIVEQALARFGRVYVIQPYREQEKCAPACWTARGITCECSCMGANHGSQVPFGRWHVVSDTFAVRWGEEKFACRLIAKPTTA